MFNCLLENVCCYKERMRERRRDFAELLSAVGTQPLVFNIIKCWLTVNQHFTMLKMMKVMTNVRIMIRAWWRWWWLMTFANTLFNSGINTQITAWGEDAAKSKLCWWSIKLVVVYLPQKIAFQGLTGWSQGSGVLREPPLSTGRHGYRKSQS